MAPNSGSMDVVRRWQTDGCRTGESLVQTTDGTVWKVFAPGDTSLPQGTADQVGYLRGGKVYPR